jgi:hypothetical protein
MQSNPIQIHQTTENKRILKIESNQKIQGGGGTEHKIKPKTKQNTEHKTRNTTQKSKTVL